jgi:hypothetical protein
MLRFNQALRGAGDLIVVQMQINGSVGQREMVCRPLGYLGRCMDGMGSRNGVRHPALMSHIIVLVHWFVVAVPEDSKGTLRLG